MSRRTEIQVGITVIAALALLIWGVTFLKDLTLRHKVHTWHVRFPQTGGLAASDEVQVNGIRKGGVSGVHLVGDHVIVDLDLDSDIVLTHDSQVAIRNVGLMGEKVIAVDLRLSGTAYADADTIDGMFEMGMSEVMASLGGTMGALNDLTVQLKSVADGMQKSGNLDHTLQNFRSTSEELKLAVSENRASLRTTMENFAAASRTAKALTTDREGELKATLASFERSAQNLERLSARMDSLRVALQGLTDKVDHGDGSLAKLVNDRKLYDDVNASVKSLNALLEDIKAHPRKYINLSIF